MCMKITPYTLATALCTAPFGAFAGFLITQHEPALGFLGLLLLTTCTMAGTLIDDGRNTSLVIACTLAATTILEMSIATWLGSVAATGSFFVWAFVLTIGLMSWARPSRRATAHT